MNIDVRTGSPVNPQVGPKLAIVCSNRGRNGKSLVARLYTDYLLLTGQNPVVFDADTPHGHLRRFFPERSELIDIVRTDRQVAMFDRIMAEPWRDYVVDLPARDLVRFFDIIEEIDLISEARRVAMPVVVLFVVEPAMDAIIAARDLMRSAPVDCFVPVQNRVFGDVYAGRHTGAAYHDLIGEGEVVIPALEYDVIGYLEDTSVSLSSLMQAPPAELSLEARLDLYDAVVDLFGQFHTLQLGFDLASLRNLGVM